MNQSDSNIDLDELITVCPFLSIIPKQNISEMLLDVTKISLNENEKLFSQGDHSDFLYILLSGQLIAYFLRPKEKTEFFGFINPGETVGELGALSREPRSLTVSAFTSSELLRISSEKFREFITNHPSIMQEMIKFIAQRSRQTIKIVTTAKRKLNIALILPLCETAIKNDFLNKLRGLLNKHDNLAIEEVSTFSAINQSILAYQQKDTEYRRVFFF